MESYAGTTELRLRTSTFEVPPPHVEVAASETSSLSRKDSREEEEQEEEDGESEDSSYEFEERGMEKGEVGGIQDEEFGGFRVVSGTAV